jgi:putative ABC transport system permease protein
VLRATFKSLLSHKLRLLLSGLAVVLGVMFVSGSLVLTDTIGRSFDAMFANAYSTVDVVVTGPERTNAQTGMVEADPVPARALDQVRAVEGVGGASGVVLAEGARAIDSRTGRVVSTFSPQFGGDWWGEDEIIELREGRGPATDDEVAINANLARTGGFSVGDRIEVLTREPKRAFTVVGIWGYSGGRDSLAGETGIAFTTPVAQELMLGQGDVYTEINALAGAGTSPEQLRDLVAAALGGDYVVRTGAEAAQAQSDQLRDQLGFFNYVLLGFAGVALFVGGFLVLNTFSIVVAQRQRELALVRAVGASRRQVVGSVLLEAAVIGAVASVIGFGLGIGLGAAAAAAIGFFTGGIPVASVGVPPGAIVAAIAVGVLVTLVAALAPALRAARVPPVAAMQQAATGDRPLTRLSVAGAVVTAGAAAALMASLTGAAGDLALVALLLGVLACFVGVALLTPLVARPVVSALGRMFAWSVPGKLGRLNAARHPRRTAITAAALMVGVALVTAVSTLFSSLSTSIHNAVDSGLRAELIISGQWTSATPPQFDPAVLERARALPEVSAVAGTWLDFVDAPGGTGFISAVDDPAALQAMIDITATAGTFGPLHTGQVLVDDRIAEQQELRLGDTVDIRLPRGDERAYEVVGIYERAELIEGYVISAVDAAGLRSPNPVQGFVQLREGADVAQVRLALERLLVDSPEVVVQDRSGFVEQQTQFFDTILIFVQALLVVAMVIAVLGVVNTLVLSVIERTRELGLLRAIGLGRGATMRMVTVESTIVSIFGALLGVAVGAGLGSAVVYALREEGLTTLTLPWGLMVAYLAAAAVVGVVAAIVPAVRAARLDVLTAIAYE